MGKGRFLILNITYVSIGIPIHRDVGVSLHEMERAIKEGKEKWEKAVGSGFVCW
ncbi:MAG: hypothetical protein QXN56_06210 [Candidatus Hadarchaeum sp.]